MSHGVALTNEQRSALLESLQTLCAIFWGPDHEKCREMLEKDYFRAFDILEPVPASEPMDAVEKIKELVQGSVDEKTLFNRLEQAYIPLFVNARGGIAAPLYQSCYPGSKDAPAPNTLMGEPAVMMKQRLAARGLAADNGLNEPPDHLAIELEYLYFLLQKGWAENNAALLSEAADFARTELLSWVPQFESRLAAAPATDPFYPTAAAILVALLKLIAAI